MANKSFQVSIDFIGNVSDLQSKIRQVSGEISKIGATSGGAQIQKQFEQLIKTVTDLQTRASQPIGSKAEFNKLAGDVSKVEMTYGQLLATIERLQSSSGKQLLELLPRDEQEKIQRATNAIKEYEQAKKDAEKIKTSSGKYHEVAGKLKVAEEKARQFAEALREAEAAKNRGFGKGSTKIATEYDQAAKKLRELEAQKSRFFGKGGTSGFQTMAAAQDQAKNGATEQLRKEAEEALSKYEQLKIAVQQAGDALRNTKGGQLVSNLEEARKAAEKAQTNVATLQSKLSGLKLPETETQKLEQAFENLRNKASELGVYVKDIGSSAQVETLLNRLNQLENDGFIQGAQVAQQYATTLREVVGGAMDGLRGKTQGLTAQFGQFMTAQEDLSMLQNRLKYFFSLTNSIQLLKRTIQSSINTVKELDAVMTETAVVTDFTVGDMWDKLPEYASKASALGSSIKDLYAATTLYYQQGLNSEQAMGVGVETMKMARIAGMEAADATQAMTAALRGFNMEVNEVNAQRVNDVYSELAAITAADTEQIATAMSKTASIANAANMEFETTSALLAQIIETTQEAPETAGTAMKTIIARFTEVKQLFSEGMLSGEDEEGEEININKIDAALRTVGISLKDFLNGSKGIDDIFLELASKWDTLDLATQRYIATTAAGSRQQSRFIAMMSNYDRTMELVSAANNSAGASQEQFDKTMESLEAKLQQLQNAWNQFTMGIANSDAIKGGIDMLTKLLETVNKLMDALSGGSGAGKGILSLMAAIGALKGGKALLAGGFGFIGRSMGIKQDQAPIQKEVTAIQRGYMAASKASSNKGKAFLGGYFNQQEVGTLNKRQALKELQSRATQSNEIVMKENQLAQGRMEKAELYGKNTPGYYNSEILAKGHYQNAEAAKAAARGYEDLANRIQATGKVTPELQQELNSLGITMKESTVSFSQLGAAAMVAGGALGLLANVGAKQDWSEELVSGLQTASAALTGLGGTLMMLQMAFPSLASVVKVSSAGIQIAGMTSALSWGWFAVIIIGVIAVVWLLVAAFKAVHAASPEGKLEAATEAANDAADAAENAAQAYEHLASALDSIGGKEVALENLAVGTTEWKDAVQELNGEILDLVEKYPELAKYVDSSKGHLSFKEVGGKTVEDELETLQENKFKAQSASAAAKMQKQLAQQDVDFDNLPSYAKVLDEQARMDLAAAEKELEEAVSDNDYMKAWQKVQEIKNKASKEDTDELARKFLQEGPKIDENGKITGDFAFLGEVGSREFQAFQDYAQSLSESDSAIKVFTDSLLSNALMIADVSEDQKTNMMNFIDSKQIDNIRKKEEDDLKKDGIDEAEKKEYAKAMEYEFINGKFYVGQGADQKEVAVSNDSIAAQLAGIRTQEDLTSRMEALDGVLTSFEKTTKNADKTQENYYTSAEGIKDAFIDLTSSAEGAGLTFKAIEELSGEVILKDDGTYTSKIFEDLFYSNENLQKAYNGDIQEFLSFIYKNLELAEARKEKATEKAVQMRASEGEQLTIEKADLSSGVISNIIDGLYDVALSSGNKAAQEMDKLISNTMTGLEPEAAQKFAQAIGDLDWTNTKDVENLSNDLEDLGIASLFGEGEIDALEQKIISLAKAARTFNADELKEAFGKSRSLAEEIRGREDTERTFTEEQMKQLIESGGAKAGEFVWTGEDEFTYIGGSMDTLTAALDANTAALLKETVDTANTEAWIAEKWQEAVQSGDFSETIKSIGEAKTEDIIYEDGIVTIGGTEYGQPQLKQIAETYGIGGETGVPEDLGVEQLVTLITEAYAKYGSEAARQGIIDNTENINATSGATAAYLQNAIYTQQQMNEMSGNKVIQQEYDSESSEANAKALRAQAYEMGVNTATIEQFNKALADNKGKLDDSTAAILTNAIADKKATANLTKTVKKVKEITDEYNNFNEVLDDDVQTIGESFGLTELQKDSKSFNFVKDNLDLIKEAVNGDVEAMQEFQGLLAQHMGVTVDATTGFVDLSAIVGATDSVTQSAMAAMNALIEAGQFEIETVEVETSGTYDVPVVGANGLITGFSKQQYSAGQTMQVVKPVDAPQIKQATGGGSGGGGGGGGGGSEWENPYDKLYNITEKINQAMREREKLERRYDRMIDRRKATAAELFKNSQKEIENLEKQAKLQQKMVDGRREMIQEELDENKDLQKYATIDKETGEITIDWDLINSVTDEEEGKRIEKYISKLEELRDSMRDAKDALEDIEDAIWEIEQRGREEYLEFEDRIKEAIITDREKEIETLEKINDSINDANSELLDAVQKSIDKMRQDRENERTEEEIGEKQRQLAYLQQDTSGANDMRILELQEEIRQSKEDYTDTLIDQKISELQEQNDAAAEQREKQITLLQNQLDWYIETGAIWKEVQNLMTSGIGPNGDLLKGSELENLLKSSEGFKGLSEIGQVKWLEDLETMIAQSMEWKMKGGQLENSETVKKGDKITFTNAKGKELTGTVDKDGNVVLDDGSYYKDVYQWIDGTYHTTEEKATKKKESTSKKITTNNSGSSNKNNGGGNGGSYLAGYTTNYTGNTVYGSASEARAAAQKAIDDDYRKKADLKRDAVANGEGGGSPSYLNSQLAQLEQQKAQAKNSVVVQEKYTQYKTGGLADFTGPAWLDGTKSRPELVLNQRDTQNFIQLKDILSSIMSRGVSSNHSSSTENNGDITYDIDINVETMRSDYDVEQVASKIKTMINEDARYRNNNAVSLKR